MLKGKIVIPGIICIALALVSLFTSMVAEEPVVPAPPMEEIVTDPPAVKKSYPKNFFASPVKRDILLSGNFGELRSNHFHAGLDIKSQRGTVGDSLFAAGNGFIARIKVQPDGYGNALYIQHPNGFTTLYGHMEEYREDIASYVKDMQYARQNFEVELFPESSRFAVKQGEYIGKMGNTGSSGGPHLHFEIRQSLGDVPVNPLLFGLPIDDRTLPSIQGLKSYSLNDKLETINEDYHRLKYQSAGKYGLYDTLLLSAWRAGFSVKGFDRMNGSNNTQGFYIVDFYVDDSLQYNFTFDRIPFSETRYLNAHIDYPDRMLGKGYWNRCFTLPGNNLNIYSRYDKAGVVELFADEARKVTIYCSDYNGNTSSLEFYVKRDTNMIEFPRQPFDFVLKPNEPFTLEKEGMRAEFPARACYENLYAKCKVQEAKSPGYYSPIYAFGQAEMAIHSYFNISLPFSGIPDEDLDKAFIAWRRSGGGWSNCGGKVFGNQVHGQVRQLGEYTVRLDKTPPTIRPLVYSRNMQSYWRMAFKIDDNIRSTGRASDLRFKATVDGKWILMEYDKKIDLLTHIFDGRIGPGEHTFELRVWDDRQNVAVYTSTFTR